jgi:hypothetical protein
MALSESARSEHAHSQETPTDGDSAETVEVPARYAREIEARERLHQQCPVEVYVAGINSRYSWPYRLVAANEARPGVADTSDTLIVDSVIEDPYYAVEDVLDAAHRLDAEYVIGKDWPAFADPDGDGVHPLDAYEWTVSRYTKHECDAELIVPLQPPFEPQTIRSLRRSDVDHFALGGLRDCSGREQVRHIRAFREIAGYDVTAHGLGVGTSVELLTALRESVADDARRPLLDSLDISTPENAVHTNKLPTKRWEQRRIPLPTGDDSTTVRAGFAEAVARMLEYELTPGCDDEIFDRTEFATRGFDHFRDESDP